MAESLLAGVSIPARARQLLDGKALNAAAMAPVIQGLLEQVEAEQRARQQAEQRAQAEHAARMSAENERQAALLAKAQAEADALTAKAAQSAAQAMAQQEAQNARHHEHMHRQECEDHKKTMDENIALRKDLAQAQAEAQAAKDEAARLRREKPAPPAQKPVAYSVGSIQRDSNGRITSMNITPGS